MATTITLNGTSYTIPAIGDQSWGDNVSNYLIAISTGVLQKTGGTFALSGELDFGGSYGLKSLYFKSRTANPAVAGALRLASADSINFRNNANSADVVLGKDASDQLTWAGNAFVSSAGVILAGGFPALSGDVTTSAGSLATTISNGAVTLAKMANLAANSVIGNATGSGATPTAIGLGSANTASTVVLRDGSGNFAAGTITAALIGNVTGNVSGTALNVTGVVASANGGTGVNNGGTLTYGANNITLTTSGVTSVTLPASGTLATLAGSETLANKTLTAPTITGTMVLDSASFLVNAGDFEIDPRRLIVNNNGSDVNAEGAGIIVDRVGTNGSLMYKATSGTKFAAGNMGSEIDLVGTTSTQTLTNKTISGSTNVVSVMDGNFAIFSQLDSTRIANFDAGSLTPGAPRLLVLPDANTTLVGTGVAQTLTNKTIDASFNTLSNIANASIKAGAAIAYSKLALSGSIVNADVASGAAIAYSKLALSGSIVNADVASGAAIAVNKLASGSAGQVLKMVGATPTWSTFSGGINYAGSDTDAEGGIGNWTLYADGAVSDPVDGTGGSPTATFIQTSAQPERGANSYQYNFGAQGNGVSLDFTIDNADKSKPISISFDYSVDSTIVEGDYRVWIYDKTNGVLIQPTPYKLPGGVVNTHYRFYANFQTASNSTSYRLIIHQAVASTADLKFDNVVVGPEQRMYGPPVTDWKDFTPTGGWTGAVAYTGKWRRVGDTMEVQAQVICSGAPTGANLSFNLPPGYSIDTSKLLSTDVDQTPFGFGTVLDNAIASYVATEVSYLSPTSVRVSVANSAGTYLVNSGGVSPTIPMTFGNLDSVAVIFRVPITGWSSSLELSSSVDRGVVEAIVPFAATNVATTFTDLALGTAVKDTHGALSATQFVVPVAGFYEVGMMLTFASVAYTSGDRISLRCAKNGVDDNILSYAFMPAATMNGAASGKTEIYLNAGDIIKWRASNARGTLAILVSGQESYGWIKRLSGPSQIAASESVSARYTAASTSAMPTSLTTFNFGTKDYDSHGAVTTGAGWKFTAPVAGKYQINAIIPFTGSGSASREDIAIRKNSSVVSTTFVTTGSAVVGTSVISDVISLLAGDTIDIQSQNTVAGGTYTSTQVISIVKVGN